MRSQVASRPGQRAEVHLREEQAQEDADTASFRTASRPERRRRRCEGPLPVTRARGSG